MPFIPNARKDNILKAVENNLLQNPKLFNGMYFYIIDYKNKSHELYGKQFHKNDLALLIEIGGGELLRREPALRVAEGVKNCPFHLKSCPTLKECSYYIIYIEQYKPKLCYNMKELRHKSSRWLLDCILNFEILDN